MLKIRILYAILFFTLTGAILFFCGTSIMGILYGRGDAPGYTTGLLESSDWNKESISRFLNIPLPSDASQLVIEGAKGNLGSYGILPRLHFSFRASPESARQFAYAFCDGILHPGYNPLEAINNVHPSDNVVLIQGNGMLYYASSPDVPETTLGNRCTRLDERIPTVGYNPYRWIEDIALDTSNTTSYIVTYRLPYEINSEYQTADGHIYIRPLGEQLRLSVSGMHDEGTEENPFVVTDYPISCFETAGVAAYGMDFYDWNKEMVAKIDRFNNAVVNIFIDDTEQPQAHIVNTVLAPRYKSDGSLNNVPDVWEYCLDLASLKVGPHTMRLVINPPETEPNTFEFTFHVRN